MRGTNKLLRLLLLLLACYGGGNQLQAYGLKQLTVKDGLSDSQVFSVCQDRDGFIWLGSKKGLDRFDGLDMHHIVCDSVSNFLANTIIGTTFEAESRIFWIQTDAGLVRYDYDQRKATVFDEFNLNSWVTKGPGDEIYVVKEEDYVHYYQPETNNFIKVPARGLRTEGIQDVFVGPSNTLWVFSEIPGSHRSYTIEEDEKGIKLVSQNYFRHQNPLLWCFHGEDEVYFVDETFTLYEYHLSDKTKHYILDLRAEVARRGDISSIIKHKGDFFVGFDTDGVLRIRYLSDQREKYQIETIALSVGVSCLLEDKNQDIVWIGTHADGVYMYYQEPASLGGILFADFNTTVAHSATTFFLDKNQTLWMGTRGSGMVGIPGFNDEWIDVRRTESLSVGNSLLGSPNVNTIAHSHKNLFWIGHDNGLNYYSYSERRIKTLNMMADGKPLRYVQSVCELNDTTLWIATAGEGIVKARISGTVDAPLVTSAKRLMPGSESGEPAHFNVIYKENEQTIWVGGQGKNVYKIDSASERVEPTALEKGKQQINHVYTILKTDNAMWFGGDGGFARLSGSSLNVYTQESGFLHDYVYSIMEDNNSDLWLTTERGVVRFDVKKNSFALCRQSEGKTVTNFSPNACYKLPDGNMILLGGSNGFVTINDRELNLSDDYSPQVLFTGLSIFGQEKNLAKYLEKKRRKETIRLNEDQNVFAVSFVATDYLYGKDYTYYYKLDEKSDSWIENGTSNLGIFTYLPSGNYTLSVKYRNNVSGKESKVFSVGVYIPSPWYATWWAYLLYIIVGVGIVYLIRWIVKRKHQKEIQQLKASYESGRVEPEVEE
ncbi:two-component regulator propeller domain-containing protein [Bacteroides sp. 224]|uniref:two-component regulator propeller domain-containing protein n=1 Tax=Bacteroides sp. 224 TaxID=2302936 RepID=UPI0013D7654B|nr:two-component regulator propeller domain-containing protein [Bacteroides sp. 224]NDV66122.1 hypothetical protein [Bacteroides sp. 224]